jgi:PAS domain S-box-containing protein
MKRAKASLIHWRQADWSEWGFLPAPQAAFAPGPKKGSSCFISFLPDSAPMVPPTSTPAAEANAADAERVAFSDIPFRGIVEQSVVGVYVVLDERFMYANETFAGMFGYRPEEFVGTHMRDLVTPDCVEEVMENYRLRVSGAVSRIHYFPKCFHRDGHIVHLEVHGSRVEYKGRPAISGVAMDITERVKGEEELRQSRQQLRELAAYLNTVREEQRAALAREVHDVLGGMLTSVRWDVLRIARRAEAQGLADFQSIATDLTSLVQETIDTARRISDELRPRILDTLGLAAALREALEHFGARYAITMNLTVEGREPALSPECATQCYRIFQEALTNVAKHAQASAVDVQVRFRDGRFVLKVKDDGCGIDLGAMRAKSLGMFSMQERALKIGGTMTVTGGRGSGTTVTLEVPTANSGSAHD